MSNDDLKILLLLNLLQDPKSESAQKKYLALFNLQKIYDQKVYEHIRKYRHERHSHEKLGC